MWMLKKLSDGTIKYLISDKRCYTVGRKNCDIILEEDASISRKHCTIYVAKQSECPFAVNTFTGVWVVDEQSKYGTYLKKNNDWVRISPGQNIKLNNEYVIKFGLMESVWSLEYKPLLVCTSGVQIEQKKNILSSLQSIDGCFKNSWCKECTLVIVNEVTLTVKVVLAMIQGIPIVTPAFLQQVVECVKSQLPFPNFEDYRPEIKEILLDKSLVSLDVKENRKELFKGKKFVIPTKKQLETLSEIITSAGGSAELFSCKGKWEKFAKDNIVVIQLPFNSSGIPEELIKSVKEVTTFLKKNYGRRVVPECEIAQAVAYASTEKFCNPKSTWFDIKIGERKEVDLGPVIAEETPIATEETKHSPPHVIPCSATMESEPLLQATTEPQQGFSQPIESQGILRQEQEVSISERKRIHSPDHVDQELQKKRARNEQKANIKKNEAVKDSPSSLKKKDLESNLNESKSRSNESKKNQSKSSSITSYFQKQNKSAEESSSRVVRQNSNDFWNCDLVNNYKMKRKISSESEDSNETLNRKKPKLPEGRTSVQKTTETELNASLDTVDVAQNKNNENAVSFPPVKKRRNFQEENDFTGFFEKEKTEPVEDLNNTLFSLTLISPAYLKEDGSLIDPPSVPVNVKRFKKQKIISLDVTLVENEDEFLNGEWIEPHPNRHNISVGE